MTSLEDMKRELRERYESLKTGNPPAIETVRRAERATVYEVDGRYTVYLYGPWAGPRIYTALKSVSFPALTRWKRIDERTSRAVFPHPTNIKVDIDRGIMGQKLSRRNPEERRKCGLAVMHFMRDVSLYHESVRKEDVVQALLDVKAIQSSLIQLGLFCLIDVTRELEELKLMESDLGIEGEWDVAGGRLNTVIRLLRRKLGE